MIFSVTERQEYKRCRRKWDLGSRNRQGLTRNVPSMALGLGTLVHTALENWAKTPDTSLVDHFGKAAEIKIEEAKLHYYERVGTRPSDSEVGPLLDALVLGRSMMINYQAYWKTLMPADFELIATEQRIQVLIPGTEHYLEGKLDMLMRNKKTSRIYVRDYKTYSSRPVEEDLFHDDQFIAYIWIANQLGFGQVAGLAYDGLWKRAAVPKKVDNRVGQMSDLFTRIRIERPIDEVIEFERMVVLEVNEMASNPPIYMNRVTWNGSCRWGCDYNKLCYAMSRGEDTDYMRHTAYMLKPAQDDAEESLESDD